jgi:RNA polymerase sigma factor (sigma-70 family)
VEPIRITTESRTCASGACAATWEGFIARFDRPLGAAVRRALARFGLRPRRELVEDLVQEAYCRLLEAGPLPGDFRGRSDREVTSYLSRIARSLVVDRLRSRRAVKRGGDWRRVPAGSGGLEGDVVARVADPAPSPEDRLLAGERRRLFLDRCRRSAGSGRVGRRNLRILELALLEGWSSREIAREVGGGMRASSVDTLIHRMKRRLAVGGLHLPRRRCSRRG